MLDPLLTSRRPPQLSPLSKASTPDRFVADGASSSASPTDDLRPGRLRGKYLGAGVRSSTEGQNERRGAGARGALVGRLGHGSAMADSPELGVAAGAHLPQYDALRDSAEGGEAGSLAYDEDDPDAFLLLQDLTALHKRGALSVAVTTLHDWDGSGGPFAPDALDVAGGADPRGVREIDYSEQDPDAWLLQQVPLLLSYRCFVCGMVTLCRG